MPRRRTIRVVPFDPLSETQWYVCRITSTDAMPRGRGVRVILEHVDEAQTGRTHTVQLPQLRPAGPTHDLLTAAGIEVLPDKDIDLAEAEGAFIQVRFRPTSGNSSQPVAFQSTDKEKTHDQRPR